MADVAADMSTGTSASLSGRSDGHDSERDDEHVTLAVNSTRYGGWKHVSIGAGIERCARDFTLSVTARWPGQDTAVSVRQGDRCEVRIGEDLVLTGWAYASPVRHDPHRVERGVSGRSLTSDIVDCSAAGEPSQWRNLGVVQIIRALVSAYGIEVVDQTGTADTLSDHTVQPGETVFESVDRLLTMSRLLATDDGRGRLIIVQPGSAGAASDAIVVGENVLWGGGEFDFSGVYSEYQCKGQQAGNDETFGAAASEVSASITDTRIARHRVKLIHESGNLTNDLARRRVAWERDYRITKALETTYAVRGWRQSNGRLWIANQMVHVVDPLIGFERDMLIAEVRYTKGDRGTIAELTIAPPDGFFPEPNDEHKARKVKKGKKGGGDNFEYLLPADWEKNA
ncbi:phage baseplate assembly protein [Paraburkholderia susongensis]|uniref:Mu-like prophage tail protein gpP n=1 Tax=Paraburkholderia susongensis TaxID=1515439 RepID=A0A1X7I6A3_9BURK|nr:baseplate protein [Paraburkholderia susongensis]SMG09341.1 Mu-like prophage tail protein gpP [Paraburkholderia susongensis]